MNKKLFNIFYEYMNNRASWSAVLEVLKEEQKNVADMGRVSVRNERRKAKNNPGHGSG